MTDHTRTNWPTIIILFCSGLVGAMQFAKQSQVMVPTQAELGLSPVMAGFSVSILGLVGVLFAITVGAVATALGLARSLRLALFGGAIVALLGAYAPDANTFLASRFLEGLSHLLIVVCAPALMADAATPKDRPLALALWGCFFGAGFAIASAASPLIIDAGGWRALLFAHGLAMLLVAVAVTAVTWQSDAKAATPTLAAIARRHLDVFTSGAPLLLALTFFAYTIQFLATLTFLIIFMTEVLGWSFDRVGIALAIAPLWSLVFTLLSGVLVRAGLGILTGFAITFSVLAAAVAITFCVPLSAPALIAALAVMMACFGLLPGLSFANMPRIAATPERATLAYSAIALFGNLGTFLGTPLLAQVKVDWGWIGIALTLAVISVMGVFLAWALSANVAKMNALRVE
jgi:predicted MFS family arabinose efflux permease